MTTIFENDLIKVITTGKDHGFIAIIDNKTDGQICIHYDEPSYNDKYEPILVAPNDWIGLLADEEGRDWVKAIENNQIYIATNDDEIGYYPKGKMVDSMSGFYDPTFEDVEEYFDFEIAKIEQID